MEDKQRSERAGQGLNIVKGDEHPEEFDHSEQSEGLLLKEIADYFDRATNMGVKFAATNRQDIALEFAREILAKFKRYEQGLLLEYSKGAHLDKDGFFWHFEIPVGILKREFPNVQW